MIKRFVKGFITCLLVLIILFEEWGWQPLLTFMGWLAKHPLIAFIEDKIKGLPPKLAFIAFVLPGVLLFPVKLLALYLLSHGSSLLGIIVILVTKLIGTALLARIFLLTEPALMQLAWFAKWYPKWKAWKDFLIVKVKESEMWKQSREIKSKARLLLSKLML